jgi:hypothetical protein
MNYFNQKKGSSLLSPLPSLLLQNSLFYILVVGEANDDDGADAVVDTVIAYAAEAALGDAAGGAEAALVEFVLQLLLRLLVLCELRSSPPSQIPARWASRERWCWTKTETRERN